jgi:hypothetical protein
MACTPLVVDAKLNQCEAAIGRPFIDKTLGAKALVTAPQIISIEGKFLWCKNTNATLAIHGDAVASSHLSLRWLKADLNKGMKSATSFFSSTATGCSPVQYYSTNPSASPRSTVSYWSQA